MSQWVIVAIPEAGDPVWKMSSEKVPHMTLLFLGEQADNPNEATIALTVQYIAERSLRPFWAPVKRRGLLGQDDADVLFFDPKASDLEVMRTARTYLLGEPAIYNAYNSVQQYPDWIPHLTVGYPKTPAKEDTGLNGEIRSVYFDRIALWTEDSDGPEFQLEGRDFVESEMAMTDAVSDYLAHYGVKGMRWGKRKDVAPPNTRAVVVKTTGEKTAPKIYDTQGRKYQKQNVDTAITVVQRPGEKLQTKGGSNRTAHPDAIDVAVNKRIARSSSTDALSTKELQALVTRLNLEQQYAKLALPPPKDNPAVAFTKELLGVGVNVTKQQFQSVATEQAKSVLTKKGLLSGQAGNGEPNPRREYTEQEANARRSASRRY